ncbi:MAG TPA: hypothetical protein VIX86_00620 [Streptosporangiaceae bacterium]
MGRASISTWSHRPSRTARQPVPTRRAAASSAGVILLDSRSRRSTSRPIRPGAAAASAPSVCQASASITIMAAVIAAASPGSTTGAIRQPVRARAASTAASMTGSASIATRPTVCGGSLATVKPGSSKAIPAASPATSRARGPTVSMLGASGQTPASGIRPPVVLSPATPQQAAGIRTEPPVSDPKETSASPVATTTADPLDEPPGTRRGSSGLTGVPNAALTPLIP